MSIPSPLRWLKMLTIASIGAISLPSPGIAADRITLHYPPFKDVSLSVRDLEVFAKQGKISPDFAAYVKQTTPAQLQQLRQSLRQRFEVSSLYVTQMTRSPLVKPVLQRLGETIQTDDRQNGMKSLRSAMISAAADKQDGLTPINLLRRFPGRQIHLNLTEGFKVYANLSELLKRREQTIGALDRIATVAAATANTDYVSKPDLRTAGTFRWQKRSFKWMDNARHRLVPGDLYLPQTNSTAPIAVIAISHGVAEDRTAFAYLAQHLASHGFAVAAIEHVGGDANRFRKYFSGLAPVPAATELFDRPRDISFLLDELQRLAQSDPTFRQLNLQQVGVIGHSLGGYTALALAGASIDFDRVDRYCHPNRALNLSVLIQCRASELTPQDYSLQDRRIKAIFAVNPIASTIFGQRGIGPVRVPTMLIGGSDDIITPAVPEQIYPFTWLQTPDKYLAIFDRGTHFSTLATDPKDAVFPVTDSLIGPNPQLAKTDTKALSVAFFQTHLAQRSEFRDYLTAAYANYLAPPARSASSQASLHLKLIPATASAQVAQILQSEDSPPKLNAAVSARSSQFAD
jgi:predicted dienelactone hydrolase